MSDVILSPINAKLVQNKNNVTTPQVADDKQNKTDKKPINKKMCTIAAAMGTIALAAVIIHKVAKGKWVEAEIVDEIDNSIDKVKNVVKKFIDSKDGSEVTNVVSKNGMMLSGDKPFSGIMEATSKSGKKAKIVYENGYMTQSFVDGKLLKKYKADSVLDRAADKFKPVSRDKGVAIFKYDEDGKKISETVHTFYDNGKIKHSWESNEKGISTVDFFENVQDKNAIKAQAKFLSKDLIEELKVYDEKGSLKLEGKSLGYGTLQETHYENGKKIKEKTGCKGLLYDSKNADASEYKSKDYDSVKYFDENGNMNELFDVANHKYQHTLHYLSKDGKDYTISNYDADFAKMLDEVPERRNEFSTIDVASDVLKTMRLRHVDGAYDLSIEIPKVKDMQLTKEELNELIERLKEILNIGKDENIQFDFDYLKRQIESIEKYMQKTYPNI